MIFGFSLGKIEVSGNKYQDMTNIQKGYQKLKVWQEAHKLVLMVYFLTNNFPNNETFGLISQMRRAVVSIAANIVEGHAKKSLKDFLRFLIIANGSLVELEYYLELSLSLKYLQQNDYEKIEQQRIIVGSLLNGFMKSVRSKM